MVWHLNYISLGLYDNFFEEDIEKLIPEISRIVRRMVWISDDNQLKLLEYISEMYERKNCELYEGFSFFVGEEFIVLQKLENLKKVK
jgi:hypothetical protein